MVLCIAVLATLMLNQRLQSIVHHRMVIMLTLEEAQFIAVLALGVQIFLVQLLAV